MIPALCVVLHAVAPSSRNACERIADRIADAVHPLPMTLLAVPRLQCQPRCASFENWLCRRAETGDEIALHGYAHDAPAVQRRSESKGDGWTRWWARPAAAAGAEEFAALELPEATRRLTAGVRWFHELRLPLQGFVAPGWALNGAAWQALRWHDFAYTCTRRCLHLLPGTRVLPCATWYDPGQGVWPTASIPGRDAWGGVGDLTGPLNGDGRGNESGIGAIVRLELHPSLAAQHVRCTDWLRWLRAELQHRQPVTLGDVAMHWRLHDSPPARAVAASPLHASPAATRVARGAAATA